jgi:hypothetical protein
MRKDEEVKEMFYWNIETLEKLWRTKAKVSINGIWITIEFGTLATVTARGYNAAMRALGEELESLSSE